MLSFYLEAIAALAGGIIALVDPAARAQGTLIKGRFPLEIVLDCAALDVLLLFAAAVLVVRAPWRKTLLGLAIGLPALALANVGRIVALYFIGVHAPGWFQTAHGEVLQLGLILLTCALFAGWVFWRPPGETIGAA